MRASPRLSIRDAFYAAGILFLCWLGFFWVPIVSRETQTIQDVLGQQTVLLEKLYGQLLQASQVEGGKNTGEEVSKLKQTLEDSLKVLHTLNMDMKVLSNNLEKTRGLDKTAPVQEPQNPEPAPQPTPQPTPPPQASAVTTPEQDVQSRVQLRWRARYTHETQRMIWETQHPVDCSKAKLLLLNWEGCGFGCQMHSISYAMTLAFDSGRVLILPDWGWVYAGQSVCNSETAWECYFERYTNCSYSNVGTYSAVSVSAGNTKDLYSDARAVTVYPQALKADKDFDPHYYLPRRFVGLGFNVLWMRHQIFLYLMKPNKRMATLIADAMDQVGLFDEHHNVIAMHVRYGDKLVSEAIKRPIEKYMEEVKNITKLYGPKDLFLSTDDPSVIDTVKQRWGSEYNVKTVDWERGKNGFWQHDVGGDPIRFGTSIMVDLYLMSYCDYFVGTFSSNIGRYVYELMYDPVAAVTLDEVWYLWP